MVSQPKKRTAVKAAETFPDAARDERAIRESFKTWMRASMTGDTQTLLSLMTDDVVFMVPGQEPFGKEAYERLGESMERLALSGHSKIVELTLLGDWAILRLMLKFTASLPNRTKVRQCGYTLTIVRRDDDGQWRVARDANLVTMQASPAKS